MKGAAGAETPVTVVVVVPVLVMFTLEVTTPPVGTSPKAIDEGAEASPSFVPSPWRSKANGPELVANVSAPDCDVGVVGVKVTGTVSVSPVASDFGSPLPLAVNGALAETLVTVTVRSAVTVTDAVAVEPTATEPKSVGDPRRATVVGRPKP